MFRMLSLDELDTACLAQWRQGAVDRCRNAAVLMGERAREAGDIGQQARAELYAAWCDQRDGDLAGAIGGARRAALLAARQRDAALEIEAWVVVCHAAAVSGRTAQALEAAEMARRLTDATPEALAAMQVADGLGVALAWVGQVDAARSHLHRGVELARGLGRVDWHSHLLIHTAFVEALALAQTWDPSLGLPSLAQRRHVQVALDAALARCEIAPGVMAAGTQRSGRFLLAWVQSLVAGWSGELQAAARQVAGLDELTPADRPWMAGLRLWSETVQASLQRDSLRAEGLARQWIELAQRLGHQPLLELARRYWLLAQARLGRVNPQEMALLRLGRSMPGEAELAQAARMAEFELQQREADRADAGLPAWRREDALTGLASREHFQEQAEALLVRTDPARAQVAVLVVALDPGQVLAAHHSPLVRDRVLCALAALMRQVLRAGDLPARWNQDELVALLHRASGEDVARVGQRVLAAVQAHDWTAIAPELQVRVCLGHASARVGDTAESLMRRAESARFASLRREYRRVPHAA